MTDKFIFYASYLETAELLERPEAAEFVLEIVEYAIYGKEPVAGNLVAQSAWPTIREVIDSKKRDSENGKKGGRPRKTPAETPAKTGDNAWDKNPQKNPQGKPTQKAIKEEVEGEREPIKGSLPSLEEEGIGAGVSDPAPAETYTPTCPNGCTKPDGSPSDMKLDADAEGLRCSVCGELLVIE